MRTPPVVVQDPRAQDPAEVTFVERDQPIQAFPPDRPDHAFTVGVGLGCSHGCLQYAQPHRSDRTVNGWRADRIAVVDQETMRGLAGDRGPTLLDRPVLRRMLGHVPMDDPPRADVELDKYIEDAEADRDRGEEVSPRTACA
jgi:hypothetical protein